MHAKSRLATIWFPLALLLALHLVYIAPESSPPRQGDLTGADSYVRLNRVVQLNETGQWFDDVNPRGNAPYGESQLYSRPLDVILMAGAWAFAPSGDFDKGLFRAGAALGPVLHLLTLLALFWAARPVFNRRLLFLIAILFLAQPALAGHFYAGRADHHSLFMLLFVVSLGMMFRLLCRPFKVTTGLLAGVVTALPLWLSAEDLLPIVVNTGTLALFWAASGRDHARKALWFAAGLCASVAVILVAERSPAGIFDIEYDRVSIVHWVLTALILGFWAVVHLGHGITDGWRARLGLVAAGGGLAAAVIWGLFPDFYRGPFAAADPRIGAIWHDYVQDNQPLFFGEYSTIGGAISVLGQALLAVPFLVWLAWKERDAGLRTVARYLLVGAAVVLPLTLFQARLAGYMAILLLFPYGLLLARVIDRVEGLSRSAVKKLWRPVLIVIFAVGFVGLGSVIESFENAGQAKPAKSGCPIKDVAAFLNNAERWRARPVTILTSADYAPELLYRTRHRVVATPNHRNAAGLMDTHNIYAAANDDDARALVEARDIALILLCPNTGEVERYRPPGGGDGLYHRLLRGATPDWLRAIALPEGLKGDVRMFETVR